MLDIIKMTDICCLWQFTYVFCVVSHGKTDDGLSSVGL